MTPKCPPQLHHEAVGECPKLGFLVPPAAPSAAYHLHSPGHVLEGHLQLLTNPTVPSTILRLVKIGPLLPRLVIWIHFSTSGCTSNLDRSFGLLPIYLVATRRLLR